MSKRWVASLLVALISAAPPLVVASIVGVFETPDSGAYLTYAQLLRAGPLPAGEELLRSGATPIPLYRTFGYPSIIAALQWVSTQHWPLLLLALQIVAQSAVAAFAHRTALLLGLGPRLSFCAALMPATGSVMVFQSAIMTDAMFGALFAGAMLALLRAGLGHRRFLNIALAGTLLAIATTIREATPYLLIGLLPAAAIAGGRRGAALGIALAAAPTLVVAGLMMADHHRRAGHAVLSTSKQIVLVQALLPLVARDISVFEGDTTFARIARETITSNDYFGLQRLNRRLFETGMTAPEIAAEASRTYAQAWRDHPLEMLRATAVRLPIKTFWIGFMPVDAAADVFRQSGNPRPWFLRPDELRRGIMDGYLWALPILALLVAGRLFGLALALGAILVVVLVRRSDPRWPALFGAWIATGAFVAVYAPVHLEQRYLIAIVPMLCILGTFALMLCWEAVAARRSFGAAAGQQGEAGE